MFTLQWPVRVPHIFKLFLRHSLFAKVDCISCFVFSDGGGYAQGGGAAMYGGSSGAAR